MLDFREHSGCHIPVYFGQSEQNGLRPLHSSGQCPKNHAPVFEDHTDA